MTCLGDFMTNFERAEFEKRKIQAEKQLNEMYYGQGGNPKNQNGFKMPDFAQSGNSPQKPKGNNIQQKSQKSGPSNNGQTKKDEHKKTEDFEVKHPSTGLNLLNMLNFKNLKMDNDRLIILALCLLLSGEETDELLLMALMYIML